MIPQKQIFFSIIFVGLGYAVYRILANFFPVIIISLTFIILAQPLFNFFHRKLKLSPIIATTITFAISLLILFIPLIFVVNSLLHEGTILLNGLDLDITNQASVLKFISNVNTFINRIPGIHYNLSIDQIQSTLESIARPLISYILNSIINIGSSSIVFITNILIFVVIVFSSLPIFPEILTYLKKLSPLGDTLDTLYIKRTISMINAVVKGNLLISLIIALFGSFTFTLVGIPYFATLFILMFFSGLIPMIGTTIITTPIAIWLLLTGNTYSALVILFVQIIVMNVIYNVLQSVLVSRETSLHPALLIISLIGGIGAFGWIGFILGPVVMILFVTTLEIYLKYYHPHHTQ